MRNGRVVRWLLLAGCVAAVAALGATSRASADANGKNVVRIGVEIAQTGDASTLGLPALKGMRFTVNRINKTGGIKVGKQKYKLQLVVRDDASSPDTARSATEQLITRDKVDAIISGVYSTVVAPGLLVAERYGVPDLTTFAYSPAVLPTHPKYSFVNVMSTVDEFRGPLQFLKSQGAKSVLLVATNDDLGNGFMQGMPALMNKYGLSVADKISFESTTTDFSSLMTQLRSSKADAVIVEAGTPLSYQFRVAQSQYKACTFKTSVYEYGPTLQPDWVNSTKTAGIGAVAETFWWPTEKGFKDRWFGNNAGFVKAFRKQYKQAPSWAAAQGALSAELMSLAIEKAGSLNKKRVAASFLKLKGSTMYGPIKFDADHFNRGFVADELVVQQQGPANSDAKIVYPPAQAEAKFQPDHC